MRRFVKRRFLIAYAVIAVLLGTGAFLMTRGGAASVQYRTAPATLGTVTQTVTLSGNLASASESDLDFGASGRINAVNVQVGQTVSAGTVLASLDTTALQATVNTAQATLQSAQAKLTLDQQGSSVASARITLQNDQTNLTDTESANQLAVAQAQAQYTQTDGCTSPSSTATSKTGNCQTDWNMLQSAQQKATQSNDQAQGQVNTAQLQLQTAEAGSSPQIQMDQSQVQIDQVNVQTAQTALNSGTLAAPAGGLVAEVNVAVGQQVSSSPASSTAASSTTTHAIVIVSPGLFNVTGSVSDAQVNEIAVSQQAQVLPAGSQEAVVGQVTQVAQEATITSGVATFPVTITLTGTNPSLRVGMSASVNVVVNQVVQVLTVPTSAVHTTAGGSTVQILVNGHAQTVSVQVGASDALRTQILSGLNAGDQVIIATVSGTVPSSTGATGGGAGGRGLGGGGGGLGGLGGGGGAAP